MSRLRHLRRAVGAGLLAVLAATAVAGFTSERTPHPGPSVVAPAGCPALPGDATGPGRGVDARSPRSATVTVVDHAVTARVDVVGAVRDLARLNRDLTVRARLTAPSTGIEVEVLSDGPVSVDEVALDALLRLPLVVHDHFDDPRLSALLACYAHRIIDRRELAGSRLRIVVPSDPRTCFRGGRLVVDGTPSDPVRCDAAGFTLPGTRGLRLLGMDVVRLHAVPTIVVTPGIDPQHADAATAFARLLTHELVHHYDNAMGLLPWVGSLTGYEQRAYYVERMVASGRVPVAFPLPVSFPS